MQISSNIFVILTMPILIKLKLGDFALLNYVQNPAPQV